MSIPEPIPDLSIACSCSYPHLPHDGCDGRPQTERLADHFKTRALAAERERDAAREAVEWFIRLVTDDPYSEIPWPTLKEWLSDFAGHVEKWRDGHADRDALRARLAEAERDYKVIEQFLHDNPNALGTKLRAALAKLAAAEADAGRLADAARGALRCHEQESNRPDGGSGIGLAAADNLRAALAAHAGTESS